MNKVGICSEQPGALASPGVSYRIERSVVADMEIPMIEIITALHPEAEGVIRRLSLKTEKTAFPFHSFRSGDGSIRLTISGTGKAVAAAAVGCILGRYEREELSKVQLVNFGNCALYQSSVTRNGCERIGTTIDEKLYLVNKLTDLDSGATYYPDLLVQTNLPEAEIITGSRVLGENPEKNTKQGLDEDSDDRRQMAILAASDGSRQMASLAAVTGRQSEFVSDRERLPTVTLYDMEAAGIYEAARLFLGPHQLHFLKGVTDHGTDANGRIDTAAFRDRMETYADMALPYIQRLADTSRQQGRFPHEQEAALEEKISTALHASVTMRMQIRQLVRYAALAGIDAEKIFDQCMEMQKGACRDRREGKLLLEQLRIVIAGD